MATLTGKQLKDSYQSLVTIKDADDANPTSGQLENGLGNPITALGIGTDSPNYKLEINGAGTVARFTNGTSHMDFYSGAGLNEIATVSPLLLSVGGTERLRIDSSGNVGIGETNPSSKFHVVDTNKVMGSDGIVQIKSDAGQDYGGQITLGTTSARHAGIAGRQEGAGGSAGYLQFGTRAGSGT